MRLIYLGRELLDVVGISLINDSLLSQAPPFARFQRQLKVSKLPIRRGSIMVFWLISKFTDTYRWLIVCESGPMKFRQVTTCMPATNL